jgi:hypothetical protein
MNQSELTLEQKIDETYRIVKNIETRARRESVFRIVRILLIVILFIWISKNADILLQSFSEKMIPMITESVGEKFQYQKNDLLETARKIHENAID